MSNLIEDLEQLVKALEKDPAPHNHSHETGAEQYGKEQAAGMVQEIIDKYTKDRCTKCNATGYGEYSVEAGEWADCPKCGGTGVIADDDLPG